MARITVEDCAEKAGGHFELVILAAKRARELALDPDKATLEWENDKPTVMALREIAAGNIDESIFNPVVESVDADLELAEAFSAAEADASK